MSLVHMDFPSGQTGLYGTDTSFMDDGLYAIVSGDFSLIEDPDPNITGNVARVSRGAANGTNDKLRKVIGSAEGTVGMGGRLWMSSLPTDTSANPPFFRFLDGAGAEVARIEPQPTGALKVFYDGGNSTSSAAAVVANAFQHIEMKVLVSATVGEIEVRVEGVPVLELTGLNTGTDLIELVSLASRNNGSNLQTPNAYYIKDWVVWTGSGTENNDFLGSVSVYELTTNSDVSFNWGASTGSTGFNLIDEAPPNDDTDYIYAVDPAPAASIFGLTNLPADVTTVKGLYAVVRSKKTDGGDGNLQVGMVSGASTGLGSDRPITTAYTYWTDMFEVDPATSAAWTPIAVDAAQLQLDRTV